MLRVPFHAAPRLIEQGGTWTGTPAPRPGLKLFFAAFYPYVPIARQRTRKPKAYPWDVADLRSLCQTPRFPSWEIRRLMRSSARLEQGKTRGACSPCAGFARHPRQTDSRIPANLRRPIPESRPLRKTNCLCSTYERRRDFTRLRRPPGSDRPTGPSGSSSSHSRRAGDA